ncbi:GTPase HflX [Streptococcus suis]|uniref:GTPase HflX n=1 Tax=Streptococcus suis TaxID=1307 RepID=A0A123SJ80_STRSU|nr:GTPase HflX [Streptococcus suis]NQH91588.1 GTPase HflX [Streptococcus suis]NQI12681.1 GTPase HflX [Streptococcus suis]NQN43106.1 GTPase HflX [Streptococcus suis]NQO73242.1 GTPase HflX [Streptococcus suis]CYU24736.1 GTPase [Streptococcus suis]
MIETQKEQERALLVGVELQQTDNFDMSMEELASLAKTAGALVKGVYTQKREKYDSKTFVGSGKLEEIAQMVEADEIDTVIVNNRLTPRQNVNLEEILGVKVIDRMQLILDIFAMRARSHEGKLQVHLAQLKYMLPRLVGQGIMLSRQAGGIGSRGPGESQLELNRRSIRNQIHDIERQLKTVEKNRATVRERRLQSGVFKIGLIGYTNAGKSTIMNAMTDKRQYEADELFATLDATTKQINLADKFNVTLTDTVGFIQDLPTELISAFKSTLEESMNVDLLLHVIDASDSNHSEQEQVVLDILKDLDMLDIPRLALYNKLDKTDDSFTPSQFPHVMLSAKDKNAKGHIQMMVLAKIKTMFERFEVRVPLAEAYKLHDLATLALIEHRTYEEDVEVVSGYIASSNKWKLEEFYDGLS